MTKAVKNLKLNYSFNKHFLSCQALSDPWGQSKCALTPPGNCELAGKAYLG